MNENGSYAVPARGTPDIIKCESYDELLKMDNEQGIHGISDDVKQSCVQRMKDAATDKRMNVSTCAVCNWWHYRDNIEPPINVRSTAPAVLNVLKCMREKLCLAGNEEYDPLLLEQYTSAGHRRMPFLGGCLLSRHGFASESPPDNPEAADNITICSPCHRSLLAPSINNNPPKFSIANGFLIGEVDLPEMNFCEMKICSLVDSQVT